MHASFSDFVRPLWRQLCRLLSAPSPSIPEPEIEREFVTSNIIVSLGYDTKRRCLQAEYFNGQLFRIDDVPPAVYQRLQDAKIFDDVFLNVICTKYKMTRVGFLLPMFG